MSAAKTYGADALTWFCFQSRYGLFIYDLSQRTTVFGDHVITNLEIGFVYVYKHYTVDQNRKC